MRLHQQKMKMLVFMNWFVFSHKSLLEEGEEELPQEEDVDQNYNELYLCCKKYLEEVGCLEQYDNYYSIAQKLNMQIGRMKKEVQAKMGESGCILMMLIVGALRHCDFEKLQGFDDLKKIDLDSIIAKAREEKYLNTWSIQSLARSFKFGYWEA